MACLVMLGPYTPQDLERERQGMEIRTLFSVALNNTRAGSLRCPSGKSLLEAAPGVIMDRSVVPVTATHDFPLLFGLGEIAVFGGLEKLPLKPRLSSITAFANG